MSFILKLNATLSSVPDGLQAPTTEAELSGLTLNYLLIPLAPILEGERADKMLPNDGILLGSHHMVVVELDEGQALQKKEAVTSGLNIIEIEQCTVTMGGINRIQNSRNTLARWSFG